MQARVLDEVQHAVIVTDSEGRITYWNPAAEALLGWPATDVLGKLLAEIGIRPKSEVQELLATVGDGGRMSGESELLRRDGSSVTAIVTNSAMLGPGGKPRGVIMSAVDISDRKRLEQRLQVQAFTDALTGLANRPLFLDRVEHVLARRGRAGAEAEVAVLFLDLDDFKTVNDSMGHGAGDELLVALGERLTRVLRPTDTAARLGGDEFAVLLEQTTLADAERVAQRILAEMAKPFQLSDREVQMSASVGIVVHTIDGSLQAEDLLRNADLAMYRAKGMLQGCYAVYQPGMHEAALRRLELKADLQRAIENDGLRLEYQPILRLQDGFVVGAEALLRWPHAERGQIPASETLELAEAAGLMVSLGSWVLDEACRQARVWRESVETAKGTTLPYVSVNASARELLDPSFVDIVSASLTRGHLPADALAVEITESDLMSESHAAINALTRLKQLGVRLAIDDFGTGYSSLAYLARFPIDVLKIDRTFVSSRSSSDGAIARAIVDLARSLHLEVIAEGIERERERKLMASLGVGFGQGYFLGRPTSGEQMTALFTRQATQRPVVRRSRVAATTVSAPEPSA